MNNAIEQIRNQREQMNFTNEGSRKGNAAIRMFSNSKKIMREGSGIVMRDGRKTFSVVAEEENILSI
jgi:hypothetical protein